MKVLEPENVRPYCQNQSFLFPPNLRDMIVDDDLSIVVDDVVNSLDLSCIYKKVSSEGNLPYHPKMMLKVLFYAYASGIFSSRKIAKAVRENVTFIYLAAWQQPNFRTINNFRKNNLKELGDLFVQIVHICQKLKMIKLGHIFLMINISLKLAEKKFLPLIKIISFMMRAAMYLSVPKANN